MKNAIVLIVGVLVYLGFVRYERQIAYQELNHLQYLYTTDTAQATASQGQPDHPSPDSYQLVTKLLSK